MVYRLTDDALVAFHLGFVLLAVGSGLLLIYTVTIGRRDTRIGLSGADNMSAEFFSKRPSEPCPAASVTRYS
jgi:hypothetical protein